MQPFSARLWRQGQSAGENIGPYSIIPQQEPQRCEALKVSLEIGGKTASAFLVKTCGRIPLGRRSHVSKGQRGRRCSKQGGVGGLDCTSFDTATLHEVPIALRDNLVTTREAFGGCNDHEGIPFQVQRGRLL
jgi:hypothetical protein